MARKSKTAVLKRQREVRKAEKAAQKREQREQRISQKGGPTQVASRDDLEGYGFPSEPDVEGEDSAPPRLQTSCFRGNEMCPPSNPRRGRPPHCEPVVFEISA